MINRLSFPEGAIAPEDPGRFHLAVGELIVQHAHSIVVLEPGTYDITPTVWNRNTHNHELVVFDNGEGEYRMLPKTSDVGLLAGEQGGARFKSGGQTIHLAETNPLAVVAGGNRLKPGINFFEVIFYLPR